MSYSNCATKPTTSHHLGLGPMVGHPPLPSRPSLPPLPPASHPAQPHLQRVEMREISSVQWGQSRLRAL
jgi:hypothetical protein